MSILKELHKAVNSASPPNWFINPKGGIDSTGLAKDAPGRIEPTPEDAKLICLLRNNAEKLLTVAEAAQNYIKEVKIVGCRISETWVELCAAVNTLNDNE